VHTDNIPIDRLSDYHLVLHGVLLESAELFVVAHEFGHIVMHICPKQLPLQRAAASLVRQALANSAKHCQGVEKVSETDWIDEVAADFLGLQLMLEKQKQSPLVIMDYSGIETFFILIHMLEIFHKKLRGHYPQLGSHPTSLWRLAFMRHATSTPAPALHQQLGAVFEELSREVLSRA
jgi:hypothetical protein